MVQVVGRAVVVGHDDPPGQVVQDVAEALTLYVPGTHGFGCDDGLVHS